MATFSQTELKLNLDQIEKIEQEINLKFPEEYKKHLLQYNGGQCSPNVFGFHENGKWTESCVDWFLAIYDGKYDNFQEYIKTYKLDKKRLPSHMIPIAHDPGGNLICISCTPKEEGYVYFWDHENEVDYTVSRDDNYSNLYLVATGFNEFLNGLGKSHITP